MKKLSLTLAFFTFWLAPVFVYADFTDVPESSDYYQAVSALEELGVVEGYPDGTFQLEQPVNRAEFLKMAYLAESKRDPEHRSKKEDQLFPFGQQDSIIIDPPCFSDFQGKEWFEPYVCWGKEKNLVEGYPDGEFKAIQGVNAAEAAKMLVEVGNYSETYVDMEMGGWSLQADHWAAGYFHAFNGPIIPPAIHSADQMLTRGEVAEWVWRSSIATEQELRDKPARALPWDGEKFVPLDYIGAIRHLPLKSYYAKDKEKIYFISVADSAIQEVEKADRESFHMTYEKIGMRNKSGDIYNFITIPVAIDDHFTYSGAEALEGSGGRRFEIIQTSYFENLETSGISFYAKDYKKVYFMGCAEGCHIYSMLPDSDADSFKAFYGTGFGKDKNHVYHLGEMVEEMDLETFKPLGANMAIDKNGLHTFGELNDLNLDYIGEIHFYASVEYYMTDSDSVYYLNESSFDKTLKKLEGADVDSFEIIAVDLFDVEGGYDFIALDKNALYVGGEKVDGSVGGSFQLVNESGFSTPSHFLDFGWLYATDDEHVYLIHCYEGCNLREKIPGGQATSFEYLDDGYAADEDQVFYVEAVLEGESRDNFEVLGAGYAVGEKVYHWGAVVENADPDTFSILSNESESGYCQLAFAQDGQQLYFDGKPIEGVDKNSVEFLDHDHFFFKDDSGVYRVVQGEGLHPCYSKEWKLIQEADAESFTAFNPYYFGSDNKVYYVGDEGQVTLIEEADFDSFEPLVSDLESYFHLRYATFATDDDHAYMGANVLHSIDAQTFEYDEELKKAIDENGEYESYHLKDLIKEGQNFSIYKNEKYNFSLNVPKNYDVANPVDNLFRFHDDPEDAPEFHLLIQEGEEVSIYMAAIKEIITEEQALINGLQWTKTMVEYESHAPEPIEGECPIYSLIENGWMYQFSSPYKCHQSDVFEELLDTFEILE